MADWAIGPASAAKTGAAVRPHHAAAVRVTHWLTAAAFFALLLTGLEIVISHPRFYWGEAGNVQTTPLFKLPIPSSRATVPTGYGYVLPDQNGWSRALHFQSAWIAVLTGLFYVAWGFASGHFRKRLLADASSYNPLQRGTYLIVIFVLFPIMIWTGLAMSPGFVSAVPFAAIFWGGRQSARTVHFLVTLALMLFVLIHIVKVALAGFRERTRAMITGA